MPLEQREQIRRAALQSYLTARRNGANESRARAMATSKARSLGAPNARDVASRVAEQVEG